MLRRPKLDDDELPTLVLPKLTHKNPDDNEQRRQWHNSDSADRNSEENMFWQILANVSSDGSSGSSLDAILGRTA